MKMITNSMIGRKESNYSYFFQTDGKIVPPQKQKYLELRNQEKPGEDRKTTDPFGLNSKVFYNLDFDIEMTKNDSDTTFIYSGVISNK